MASPVVATTESAPASHAEPAPVSSAQAVAVAAQAVRDAPAWFAAHAAAGDPPAAPAPPGDHPASAPTPTPLSESVVAAPTPGEVDPSTGLPAVPATLPAAAPTTPTGSEWERWVARNGGDPAAAGRAAFEADSRAAAAANELKELRAKLAAPGHAPAPVVAPVPADPQPGQTATVNESVDATIARLAGSDPECNSWATSYHANKATLATLSTELAQLDSDIANRQAMLASDFVDEMRKPDLANDVLRLQLAAAGKARTFAQLRDDNRDLRDKWAGKRQAIASHVVRQEQARAEQASLNKRIDEDSQALGGALATLLPQLFTEHGIAPEDQDWFKAQLYADANANMARIPKHDPIGWMKERGGYIAGPLKRQAERLKAEAAVRTEQQVRDELGRYTAKKLNDVAIPGPHPGAAASAPRPVGQRITSAEAHRLAGVAARQFMSRR